MEHFPFMMLVQEVVQDFHGTYVQFLLQILLILLREDDCMQDIQI